METLERAINAMHLARAEGIGPARARKLLEHFGNADAVLHASKKELQALSLLPEGAIRSLRDKALHAQCRLAVEENAALGARSIVIGDPEYPQRLLNCSDAPLLLFVKGHADLNAQRIVAIVGTRRVSDYGVRSCEWLIEQLAPYGVTVVSGMAYGVDIVAHRAALAHGLPGIACMAHGIQTVYPSQHRQEAERMLEHGGAWITEYPPGTFPVRTNFPERNRVIAGLADATIVIESNTKGGSMITARIAASYHREVFAVPGEITKPMSAGCNSLIRNMEAQLLSHGAQVARELGWESKVPSERQLQLFLELNEVQRSICQHIAAKSPRPIDLLQADLAAESVSPSQVLSELLELELLGVIRQYPGKRYSLA